MSGSSCGHTNPERARFCMECGAALARCCASCRTELPAEAKFCLQCGTRVNDGPAAPATPAGTEREPRSYTPKHLAEKILTSRAALEGERKQVTVLFADVKGSMELAEQLDPEAWHTILDRFFQILTDGVHRFEGTVNQYTGDGIMALFGAPIAHEDHAQRACYAALQLLEELRGYAREVKRAHGLDFAVRIGLNSGDVVVGRIGDDLRMDYTAQGHTVGLAQRMEGLAEANSCFVSAHTAALVSGYFDLVDLGRFTVKGTREPIGVFQLRGVGRLRTRLDVSRTRGFSKFVGRGQETSTLEQALARAMDGQGQVVGVVADAGTGKSRLCFEFVERRRHEDILVRDAARCLEQGLATTRERRSFLSLEPLFLIALARAHLGRGDAEAARARAEEAIALAPDRGVHTADAHLCRARALVQSEGTARGEIESAIADGERFVQSSGAHSRQPAVHELRAELARLAGDEPGRVRELREAARLFTEMGATRQATRVAEELAGTTAQGKLW